MVNKKKSCGKSQKESLSPLPLFSVDDRPESVPAAGYRNGTSLNNAGENGNYWSSTPNESVYMNVFDQYVKRTLRCKHYGRYVDDAFIVSGNRAYLKRLIPVVTHFLKEELGLEVSAGKTSIRDTRHGVEFLGAYVKPFRTYVSTASLKRIKRGMKRLATADLGHLQSAANSYLGVLSHYDSYRLRRVLFGYLSRWDTCGHFTPDWLRFSPA